MENRKKMHSVLFCSRNKDNSNVPDFKERRAAFLTHRDLEDPELMKR
jgi:hypothetical protein